MDFLDITKPWKWSCHRKRIQENWTSGRAKMVTVRRFLPNLSLLAVFPLSIFKRAQLWPVMKFKSLASSAWCALALGTRFSTIAKDF